MKQAYKQRDWRICNVPSACVFKLTINFRAHFPLLEFHFLGLLQRVLADGGRFEGQNGDSEKDRISGNLRDATQLSKAYSMVHPPALSLLLYIALLPIGVLLVPVETWRPDWPRVSTCVHEKRSIARVQGQTAPRTRCPLLSFFL